MAPLTEDLRKASRQVHDISDALVNARLVALFTSRTLYAKAIGCFYLVFEELEKLLGKHASDSELKPFMEILSQFKRAEAFASDLEYYLGPDWARLVASGQTEAVAAYKEHLRKLAAQQPLLLLAHAYTQYMAMAAGGQIIRRAARRQMGLPEDRGTAAFEFAAGGNALRADLKDKLNTAAGSMSSATQTQLVYEHCMAFRFNNAIIRSFNISLAASVRGALQLMPAWARLALIVLVLLVLAAAWTLAKRTIL